ncbi:MAG: nuclear transport factor 2 family protein [Candidatus Sulfotelmatobacter sp.]
MSRKASACLSLLIGLALATASAQGNNEAESKVMALERLWGSAVQLRDTQALGSIFDDSLIYVTIGGKLMTKTQVLADTRSANPVDVVVQSSVARLHGNIVIVTGLMQLKGVEDGKPYLRYARFMDTWMNKDNRWVCISSMSAPFRK